MNNTHKKALGYISSILESIDTYPTYKNLQNLMIEKEVDKDIFKRVLEVFSATIEKEIKKVKEAKEWVETITKDLTI